MHVSAIAPSVIPKNVRQRVDSVESVVKIILRKFGLTEDVSVSVFPPTRRDFRPHVLLYAGSKSAASKAKAELSGNKSFALEVVTNGGSKF